MSIPPLVGRRHRRTAAYPPGHAATNALPCPGDRRCAVGSKDKGGRETKKPKKDKK
jgi:hypothetical protein